MALTIVGALIVPVVRDSALTTTLAAAIAASLPFATRAVALLRDLAAKGAAFQKAMLERTEAAVEQVKKASAQQLQDQEAAVASARASVETLRAKMADLAAAARQAQRVAEEGERRRREAGERLAAAAGTAGGCATEARGADPWVPGRRDDSGGGRQRCLPKATGYHVLRARLFSASL